MWVDEDGVAHTVALPKPQQLMTKSFRRALDELRREHLAELNDILTSAEDALFLNAPVVPDEPHVRAYYEGRPPPKNILDGVLSRPENFRQALEQVDFRWKLDVVLAIQDYVDK